MSLKMSTDVIWIKSDDRRLEQSCSAYESQDVNRHHLIKSDDRLLEQSCSAYESQDVKRCDFGQIRQSTFGALLQRVWVPRLQPTSFGSNQTIAGWSSPAARMSPKTLTNISRIKSDDRLLEQSCSAYESQDVKRCHFNQIIRSSSGALQQRV